jgi:hypothetical protein
VTEAIESVIRAQLVDERTSGWELNYPKYRVYIWSRRFADIPTKMIGWTVAAYELEDVGDGTAAIGWAESKAAEKRKESNIDVVVCVVYARVERGPDRGIVRIHGFDPNRSEPPRSDGP